MWQIRERNLGLVREASSQNWTTPRKVMNEDMFRTDVRLKNIQLPNRWYHYASWKVYPEWNRMQPGSGTQEAGSNLHN